MLLASKIFPISCHKSRGPSELVKDEILLDQGAIVDPVPNATFRPQNSVCNMAYCGIGRGVEVAIWDERIIPSLDTESSKRYQASFQRSDICEDRTHILRISRT